ncbi:MAG: hypothetical protein E7020_00885 [Alphaproteobacteria bacterium]|nr:hypothetical protein [Alphaproteobacteria bacterium]
MKEKEIYEFICTFVANRVGVTPRLKSDLYDYLGLDIFDMMELVIALEEKYVIHIDEPLVEKWKTIEDVVNTVCEQIS